MKTELTIELREKRAAAARKMWAGRTPEERAEMLKKRVAGGKKYREKVARALEKSAE